MGMPCLVDIFFLKNHIPDLCFGKDETLPPLPPTKHLNKV